MKEAKKARILGKHIVADPAICHGRPTFKGTRVMVYQVLQQVAYGTPWERIVWSWRGKVSMEAIQEAVWLAGEQFKEARSFKGDANHRRLGGLAYPALFATPGI